MQIRILWEKKSSHIKENFAGNIWKGSEFHPPRQHRAWLFKQLSDGHDIGHHYSCEMGRKRRKGFKKTLKKISTLLLKITPSSAPWNTAGGRHFQPGLRSSFLGCHSRYLSNGVDRCWAPSLSKYHFVWLRMSWSLFLSQCHTAFIC